MKYTFKSDESYSRLLDAQIRGRNTRDKNTFNLYYQNPKYCLYCVKLIPYEPRKQTNRRKFCSHSCAASFNNLGVVHNGVHKSIIKCVVCMQPLKLNKKFCSRKCSGVYQKQEWLRKWHNNEIDGVIGTNKYSRCIRNYLFEKYDSKCARCGWCEVNLVTGKCPLQIDHIDGNWQNNKEENLILLCPSCHSLTPTYMALNKGHGRPRK